ncbi:Membrane protein involved in the export of O-antigen and teichoic acid [Bacteroides luti]|uniref:Membrane protein involved in the export of O-antigen and teichoic acid n=1 Tax=Bacteroides luti TaxID=1297750 RepID=A0A1M4Z8R6_9BACE|nr:oligosaccharide flippase family protein [Bacteroides luti]SHF14338.1 Membrane protein involved in the export of O-antigen and teichoic acid [Bacteroides luti]
MAGLKSLAKDTAIYGVSSIVGRFLNYLLVPLYTAKLSAASGGYGVITNMYSITALLLVILTYGMETGFFRFVNKKNEDPTIVYSTTLISVGVSSLLFILLCFVSLQPISTFLGYENNPDFVAMMAIVVALDSFQCIPFAYLRYKKRPIKFAAMKFLFIIPNILLNIFFFVCCPWLLVHFPASVSWFYNPSYGVGYAFVANVICTVIQQFAFYRELTGFKYKFKKSLWKEMMIYSFPILILGIAGILNQVVDKIIFPFLFTDQNEARVQLGIYGAASKVAMVMTMFTQAFRYAYEPFVFGKNKEEGSKKLYADAMKYFIIVSLIAYLGVMFYLDIFRYIIDKSYWDGLDCVSIVMLAAILNGIYFNLSFWYKLIDKTIWGAYFSGIGCFLIIILNVIFVPHYGYMACAWASLIGYAIVTILSYVVGQKKYPINYDMVRIGKYCLLTVVLYAISEFVKIDNILLRLCFKTILFSIFIAYIIKKDFPLKQIPIINRFVKK